MKLFIHIGSPKCGSTYLQRVMLKNLDVLFAQDICYPPPLPDHPGNVSKLQTIPKDTLMQMFQANDTVLLSHEDLFAVGAAMADTAALCKQEGIEVEILAFLRPFSEFIFGDYSQFIKQNIEVFIKAGSAFQNRSFERFAVDRNRVMAPAGYLRSWKRAFPDSPLTINSHRNIRTTIEERLGVRNLDWTLHTDDSNPSLRMCDCDQIVTAINAGVPGDVVRDMLHTALKLTRLPDSGKTPERILWLEALFGKANEEIAAEFGFFNSRKP
jgi:hypothetical protein